MDVPAKLSARVRLFDTGHNRKTDAHDAHAVAVVAVRTMSLRVLSYEEQLEVLRMLVDRREEVTRQRIQVVNRLQRLLSELTPGKVKKDITRAVPGCGRGLTLPAAEPHRRRPRHPGAAEERDHRRVRPGRPQIGRDVPHSEQALDVGSQSSLAPSTRWGCLMRAGGGP